MTTIGRTRRERLPDRGERRFLIDEKMARLVLVVLGRHLALTAEERSTPWLTTVYCDTPDWRIFRAARKGTGVFMRFREYHVRRPSRAFSAPRIWLEFKPVEQFTGKTRYELPARAIPALMRGDVALLNDPGEAEDDLARLLEAGVRPVLVTQYRRKAYSSPGDTVRITADSGLSYRTLPEWNLNSPQAVPTPLGPVFATHFGVVVEMKWTAELPSWAVTLAEFLRTYSSAEGGNKFLIGASHLRQLDLSLPSAQAS